MYTKVVVWATSATPLPMWDPEGSGMVPVPNMVADFRDSNHRQPKRGLLATEQYGSLGSTMDHPDSF
jgi:hypothetical protein